MDFDKCIYEAIISQDVSISLKKSAQAVSDLFFC